jgi:hypothetical protein
VGCSRWMVHIASCHITRRAPAGLPCELHMERFRQTGGHVSDGRAGGRELFLLLGSHGFSWSAIRSPLLCKFVFPYVQTIQNQLGTKLLRVGCARTGPLD